MNAALALEALAYNCRALSEAGPRGLLARFGAALADLDLGLAEAELEGGRWWPVADGGETLLTLPVRAETSDAPVIDIVGIRQDGRSHALRADLAELVGAEPRGWVGDVGLVRVYRTPLGLIRARAAALDTWRRKARAARAARCPEPAMPAIDGFCWLGDPDAARWLDLLAGCARVVVDDPGFGRWLHARLRAERKRQRPAYPEIRVAKTPQRAG